jgi:hypothetical protein
VERFDRRRRSEAKVGTELVERRRTSWESVSISLVWGGQKVPRSSDRRDSDWAWEDSARMTESLPGRRDDRVGITRIARSRCLLGPRVKGVSRCGPRGRHLFRHDGDNLDHRSCKDHPSTPALDHWQPCSWRGRSLASTGLSLPSPAPIRCLISSLRLEEERSSRRFRAMVVDAFLQAKPRCAAQHTSCTISRFTTGLSEVPSHLPEVHPIQPLKHMAESYPVPPYDSSTEQDIRFAPQGTPNVQCYDPTEFREEP